MSTFKTYVVIQAMTFVFGIVGPIFDRARPYEFAQEGGR
jgi:hypothetical protein